MNRDIVGWIPYEQYRTMRRSRRIIPPRDPEPAKVDPLLIVVGLLLIVAGGAALVWYTNPSPTPTMSNLTYPAAAPRESANASGTSGSSASSYFHNSKEEKVEAFASSAPGQVYIQTYKQLAESPLELPTGAVPSKPAAAPSQQAMTTPPVKPAPTASTKAANAAPAKADDLTIPTLTIAPPPAQPEQTEPVTIAPYVEWPVLLPTYLLPERHAFQDWCDVVKRTNYGEAAAVLGVVAGPEAAGLDDPAYLRFRNETRQKLIDLYAQRDPNGTYRYIAPSYHRTYNGHELQFMRAYAADSRTIGLVVTLVQDGRAFAYLFDGHAAFYGTYVNSVGEAYVVAR